MRMRLFVWVFIAVVLVGCGRDKKTEPVAYAIKLERPQPKGTSLHVRVTGNFEEFIKPISEEAISPRKTLSFTYVVDVVRTVLTDDLTAEGPLVQLAIVKATKTTGEETKDLFPPRTVVVEKKIADRTDFFVGDTLVDINTASILRIAGLAEGVDPGKDDLIYGAKELKRLGDSWPINAEEAATHSSKLKIVCQPENISGSMRLKEVVESGSEQLLALEEETVLRDCVMPLTLPEGFSVLSSHANQKALILYPVDLLKPARHRTGSIEITWIVQKEDLQKKVSIKVIRQGAVEKEIMPE
ncbi:MAG: hypothetical protein QM790_07230 [Nibricoccus sp.]